MKTRLVAITSAVMLTTTGCEQPFDSTPPGYAEACYGGQAAAKKSWVCSEQRLVVSVEGTEQVWPQLAMIVSDIGHRRGLEVFDTSTNRPNYVRTLEISVCSTDGLFLSLDKRVYADESMNREGNRITARLRTYKETFEWKALGEELVRDFEKYWPGSMQAEWPEPIGTKRALPDSVGSCDE